MADLNSEQKRAIKSTILECRGILEKDIEQVLINLGIYIDEEWVDINNLTNLNEEQRKVRENIEQVIEKLGKGGFDKNKAVREYIIEVAYTYLNRIAALRVLEARGLIDEILISRPENGDKSFINSRFYEVAREYCKYNMDEGLAYIINLMFEEIGEEIKLLFSTEDEYSFISPSSNGLLTIIKLLCTDIDEESWQQDEIIGWIYQYFNDKEKDDVFDRLYNKKQKIKVEDIPAATQLFTPNWIVEWIVDNSLGNLWNEMKNGKRQGKSVEEIKLLDPCCGSGHFLVKAYDLFYKMYLEEGKYSVEEIPFKILQNNIHGIDIDLRAVQLTGLILFIKTKSYLKKNDLKTNTKGKLLLNLVCADAILLNGNRLEELRQKYVKKPVVLKMLDIIYEEFKDVRLKGSLIQPEKKLFPLFEETKHKAKKELNKKSKKIKGKQTKGQLTLENNEMFNEIEISSFSKEDQGLINTLVMVYNEAVRSNDINKQLFASETVKSVKLIEIFMKEYDIVVTNPPYMGKRNMNDNLVTFIKSAYSDFDNDLYSVFIKRCTELMCDKGYFGIVCQSSFLFTSTFKEMRKYLLDNYYFSNTVVLGPRAFDDISGEKVNTVMFILQNKSAEDVSKFLDLREYKSSSDKYSNMKEEKYISLNQKEFLNIDGYMFIYWANNEILKILSNYKKIGDFCEIKQGLVTGNNDRFIRFNWETNENSKWVKYVKGGIYGTYYNEPYWYVNWANNGEEIKNFKDEQSGKLKSRPQNEKYYFKEGLVFSRLGGKNLNLRYLPEGYIFDVNAPLIYTDKVDIYYVLGFLNSKLARYFLDMICPTITNQVGDVLKIPFIENANPTISMHTKKIIEIKKELLSIDELNSQFQSCGLVRFKGSSLIESFNNFSQFFYDQIQQTKELQKMIDDEAFKLFNISERTIGEIESKSEESREFLETTIEEEVKKLFSSFIGNVFGRFNSKLDEIKVYDIVPINSSIYLEEDIIEQFYNYICIVYGEEIFDSIIGEIEDTLKKPLEEYFIKDFYNYHISQYNKRPIYWHICSPKKVFNCFVYYHKLDEDTLYKVKSMYLAKMIERYEEDLKYYNEQLIKARVDNDKNKEKDFKNRCSDLEEKLEDLNILDKNIMDILPYEPDLDQGVLYNIIPIESILAARVSTDKERQKYYEEVKKK